MDTNTYGNTWREYKGKLNSGKEDTAIRKEHTWRLLLSHFFNVGREYTTVSHYSSYWTLVLIYTLFIYIVYTLCFLEWQEKWGIEEYEYPGFPMVLCHKVTVTLTLLLSVLCPPNTTHACACMYVIIHTQTQRERENRIMWGKKLLVFILNIGIRGNNETKQL